MTKRSLLMFWALVVTYSIYFAAQHYYVSDANLLKPLVDFTSDSMFRPRVLSYALCHVFCGVVARVGCNEFSAMHMFFVGWDVFCLIGSELCLFFAVKLVFRKDWLACTTLVLFLANLTAIFLLPRRCNYFYPYDVSAIFFTALVLYLTVSRKPLWCIALALVVGTVNRESILFSIPMVLFLRWDTFRPVRRWLPEAVTLLVVWGLVKTIVQAITVGAAKNVVSIYDKRIGYRAVHNIYMFFGEPMMLVKFMVCVGFIWMFAFWSALKIPHRFARCAWAILPVAGMMWIVGNYDEVRVFGETAVFASLACAALIATKIDILVKEDKVGI